MSQKNQMADHYRLLRANGMSHSEAFAVTGSHFQSKSIVNTSNPKPQELVSSPVSKDVLINKKDSDWIKNAVNYNDLYPDKKEF